MTPSAIFEPDGANRFVPTAAAVGPWDAGLIHGAAIAALLAGRLTPTDRTLARLTVDILAPVPLEPLHLELSEPYGGARVQRRSATLTVGGRSVATATSVCIRRRELELPARSLEHESPFDPTSAPPLDRPNHNAKKVIGWESFDSTAAIFEGMQTDAAGRTMLWLALALPVVAGSPPLGTELAAVAADYAQSGVHQRLPYDAWSFRNAELTLHLARTPVGGWIGVRCESVVDPTGGGFNTADLFDPRGRLGAATSAVVIEPRTPSDRR